MSNLKKLNSEVSERCMEEINRLGIRGVGFVQKTGLSKQTFSAVVNGVNSAPTGFISALCTHYPADVSYIMTGVRESDMCDNTAFRKRKDIVVNRSATQETMSDDKEKEMLYMKKILELKDRLIAAQEQMLGLLKEKK